MREEDRDRRRALVLGALATCLYLASAPALVNLDGLGYLKLLPHNFAAGHLLFMPLLRAATRVTGDGLRAGRLLDALLGGTGVVLVYGIARRLAADWGRAPADARFIATFAAAGLAVSYGYWTEAADVEAYAFALMALLGTVRLLLAYRGRPTFLLALASGALLGISVLAHLTHVLLAPLVALWLAAHAPRGRARLLHPAAALALAGAAVLDLYAYAAFAVRGHDLPGALKWIATAAHGFRYQGGPYRLADAVYGLAKALVYAPYLHEANAPKLLGQFLLGLSFLVLLVLGSLARRRELAQLDGRMAIVWVLPYALFAFVFFGSDPERWLFVLPPLFILGGVCLVDRPRRARAAALVVGALFAINLATGILPAHRDADGTRFRAETSARALAAGDLLVFPGHSWDEYVTLFAAGEVEPFPVSYYAARDGVDACFARLGKEIDLARARGGRVFAARLFDDGDLDEDRRGWDELAALGLPRVQVRRRVLETRALRVSATGGPLGRLEAR